MSDPTASSRKRDHIDLAFESQANLMVVDDRFFYEPMLAAHPAEIPAISFLGKTLRAPVWVSSMTGGTEKARSINQNLARACAEFGMGMGLGSCRSLLEGDQYLQDFNVRGIIGDDLPLYANLGIAQIESLLRDQASDRVEALVDKLRADGLFIHVNPLQEWLQPEGDRITVPPIETIAHFLELHPDLSVVVKEVGQGIGKKSLKMLMRLPVDAIEFAAHGGTNFSSLELLRGSAAEKEHFTALSRLGHTAGDMVNLVNDLLNAGSGTDVLCDQYIISGGVRNFLDGYYLTTKLQATAVYGQASALLKHAANDYAPLREYLTYQLKGYALAQAFLRLRK